MATDFLTPIQVGAGIVARGQQMRAQKQQMEQANALFPLQMAEAQMGLQSKALEIQSSFLNRQIMLKNQEGAMELGNLLASSNFDDPMLRPKVMGLISRYPHIAQTKEFQYALEGFKIAEKAASDMEIAKTRANATIESAKIRAAATQRADGSFETPPPEVLKLSDGTEVIWQRGSKIWKVKENGKDVPITSSVLAKLIADNSDDELVELSKAELKARMRGKTTETQTQPGLWNFGQFDENGNTTLPDVPVSAMPPALNEPLRWNPNTGWNR